VLRDIGLRRGSVLLTPLGVGGIRDVDFPSFIIIIPFLQFRVLPLVAAWGFDKAG